MSIVKIQPIKSLTNIINYSLQEYKTESGLISTHSCTIPTIQNDFNFVQEQYNLSNHTNKELKSRTIYQSFSDEDSLTPEKVHELGIELAKRYLKDEHQYVVITHEETNNLHNHIIFNSVNEATLKMFNSTRQHTINDLRKINDLISKENDLSIPVPKAKSMSFNEYVVRSKNTSFKQRLENIIDTTLQKSQSFDDFLLLMKQDGYEAKKGKYLSFKHQNSSKFIRTKTLGFNYSENSLLYRLEHKEYVPVKQTILEKQWIRKEGLTGKKRENATQTNLSYLSELSDLIYKDNMTLSDVAQMEQEHISLNDYLSESLSKTDEELFNLESKYDSFDTYTASYGLMNDYKKSKNKKDFKSKHYAQFKRYDVAKKNIYDLKKNYNIHSKEELSKHISLLKRERDTFYNSLSTITSKKELTQTLPKKKREQERE